MLDSQHRIILIGPQGSGKGTQGELLQVYLQIPTISTGHLCRTEIECGTELGKQLAQYVHAGALVPDEIISAMLKDRLKEYDASEGFIVDGFPRTVAQAAEAEDWLKPTKVIVLEVNDKVAIERMSSRRACSNCRYKTTAQNVALHGDMCPRCNGKIIQRADDLPEVIAQRLKQYHELTQPVVDFYKERGIKERFNGALSIPLVFMEIAHML